MAKKKKEEELDILKEQKNIEELVRKYKKKEEEKKKGGVEAVTEFSVESREYEEFRKGTGQKEAKTIFEKLCRVSGKLLTIKSSKKAEDKLDETLFFIGYNVTASDVKSLSVVLLIILLVAAGSIMAVGMFPLALFFVVLGLVAFMAAPKYPEYVKRIFTMETLNSMPLAVTYMVIYMRSAPTLEGAVRFSAQHMTGAISRDMKKLLWDFETGTYSNMDDAIKNYEEKWKDKNRHFAQALELLRASETAANEEKRIETLNEAAKVVLEGNLSMMKEFARGMRMPIVALYMLSIVLPVMGLILAPMMTSFMASSLSARWLIVSYNIVLPLIVYGTTKMIMSKRPGAFQQPDIADYEGLPTPGHFAINIKSWGKTLQIPLWPMALVIGLIIATPGIFFLIGETPTLFTMGNLLKSMTIIWGTAVGIILYTLGSSYQKLKLRKSISDLEKDISVFAYSVGSEAEKGTPIEGSIRKIADAQKAGPLKEFLNRTNNNIVNLGMTLKNAVFNPESGSLKYYPSTMLRTLLEILMESAEKGLNATAISLKSISKYLANLKNVEENIKELIGDTISTMRFQAQFLNSFITGIIVALNVLIFNVLTMLGGKMASMETSAGGISGMTGVMKNSMFDVASSVPASHLQIIVGIYMIQTTVLMSILINGAEKGRDDVNKNHMIGSMLLTATILYTIVTVIGVFVFSRLQIGGAGF